MIDNINQHNILIINKTKVSIADLKGNPPPPPSGENPELVPATCKCERPGKTTVYDGKFPTRLMHESGTAFSCLSFNFSRGFEEDETIGRSYFLFPIVIV